MNQMWQGVKEALTATCKVVLGPKKKQNKEWITKETLQLIVEKQNDHY